MISSFPDFLTSPESSQDPREWALFLSNHSTLGISSVYNEPLTIHPHNGDEMGIVQDLLSKSYRIIGIYDKLNLFPKGLGCQNIFSSLPNVGTSATSLDGNPGIYDANYFIARIGGEDNHAVFLYQQLLARSSKEEVSRSRELFVNTHIVLPEKVGRQLGRLIVQSPMLIEDILGIVVPGFFDNRKRRKMNMLKVVDTTPLAKRIIGGGVLALRDKLIIPYPQMVGEVDEPLPYNYGIPSRTKYMTRK